MQPAATPQNQQVQPAVPDQATSPKPVRVSPGALAGQLVTHTTPVYPPLAKTNQIEGAVVLKAIISKEGDVENLTVLSGPLELRASAIDAVRLWKYKPYLLNGQPTEVDTTITVHYTLGNATPNHAANPTEDPSSTDSTAPVKLGPGITPPVVLTSVEAKYTPQALKDKISGKVLVRLVVDTSGNPTNVRVVRSLNAGLDEKAVEAIKQYKFNPAVRDGQPVATELSIEVNFRVF